MPVNWEARRRDIAEFKHLNPMEPTPALIAEKAKDLAHRFRDHAVSQAEYRGRNSSTERVRRFWAAVVEYLTGEEA